MMNPKSRAIVLVVAATALLFVLFCPASPAAELSNDDARRAASVPDTPFTLPPDSIEVSRGRPLTALDIFLSDLNDTVIAYALVHRTDGTIDVMLLDPISGDAAVVCTIAAQHGDVPIENVLVGGKSYGCHG